MKKIIIILILFFSVLVSQAQKDYSQENLEQVSQEELDIYFNKAVKLHKTGKTLMITGAVSIWGAVVFGIIGPNDLSTPVIAAVIGAVGIGVLGVGIPMNKTGKNRVERINTIKNTSYDDIKIDLKPCAQYNFTTQNYQPGITLKIRF